MLVVCVSARTHVCVLICMSACVRAYIRLGYGVCMDSPPRLTHTQVRKWKTSNTDKTKDEFVIAGGSHARVLLWRVNTTKSTDNAIVWRAYDSSYCSITPLKEMIYHRIK